MYDTPLHHEVSLFEDAHCRTSSYRHQAHCTPHMHGLSFDRSRKLQSLSHTYRKLNGHMKHQYAAKLSNHVQNAVYGFKFVASKIFPRFIRRPFPKGHLQSIRQRDPDQNAKNSPPTDEFIDLCSIWAIEFYTPSHMDRLLSSLEHLGWAEGDSRNPVSWLQHRDATQFGQSWMPLGPVIPRNVPDPFTTRSLRADLPAHVQCAYGDIYCVTPSLVAIVFEFTFDEEYSRILDNALRQERKSYVTPIPEGHRIHNPGSQRVAHIQNIRKDASGLIANWFSTNIPGLCSAGLLDGEFPTCEFVSLRKAQPFPTRQERGDDFLWYLFHLGMSNSHGTWQSADLPALRFSPSSDDRHTARFHSMLSINEVSWREQDPKEGDSFGRESRIYDMHHRVTNVLGIWWIVVLLEGYANHFKKLRNSEFLRPRKHGAKLDALRRIGDSVSYSVDIAAVTAELTSLVRSKRPLGFDVESFVPRSDVSDYFWKGTLEQLIHRQVGENANWIQSMDKAFRDHLTQFGTIIGIEEDIRLQNKISRLTYAMLVLTFLLAILTLTIAQEHLPWIGTIWRSLGDLLQVSRVSSR